jgi:hypothetical protein
MDNLTRIKSFSRKFHHLLTLLLTAIPAYYIAYWVFINQLPETLITVNTPSTPLVANHLPPDLQVIGFMACLLPLSALTYGLVNVRRLFAFYARGAIFSYEHVAIFKKTAKALIFWVILSMTYESVKSILFSYGNPPGSRVVQVGFGATEIATLMVGGILFVIAWVMDVGRSIHEENELTV